MSDPDDTGLEMWHDDRMYEVRDEWYWAVSALLLTHASNESGEHVCGCAACCKIRTLMESHRPEGKGK